MRKASEYEGPLAGLKVIDFGWYYAGPMAGMMLADQGATVIRIAKPGEKELSEQQYRLLNRNKKLLEIDLNMEDGRAAALFLIENADVLIENFRPGVMKRLGLDYESVKDKNPGLIYLSLPGFASTDNERSHIRAWEGVLGAASGLYTDTHWMRLQLNFPPVYSWVPHCSAYGAMHGVIAVMAALLARAEQGCGTVIEVPLVDAGLAGFAVNCLSIGYATDSQSDLPTPLKSYVYSPNDVPSVQLNKLEEAIWNMTTPTGRVYTCLDGRKLFVWCTDGFLAWDFLEIIGIGQKVRSEGFVEAGLWDTSRADNNISASYLLRSELKKQLVKLIAKKLLTKKAEDWEAILLQAGLLAVVVRTREEYLSLSAMHESGVLTKMGNDETELTVPGRIVDISSPRGEFINGFKEAETISVTELNKFLGKNIPKKMGVNKAPLLNKGDLLKGLKVLDLSNVVAGPVATWTLAEYGAEVIKAASPSYIHPLILPQTIATNQGKRSIILDPTTAQGRQAFEKLISWADVVLHNSLDDTAQRLGVKLQQLQAINPNVVSCQFTAFGGSYPGGWEGQRGFDPLACMATGMMAHYGTLEQPQPHGSTSCGDVMGGLCAAFATLVTVYQKRINGYSGEARASLVRANNYIQFPYMIADKDAHSDWGESRGQSAMGKSWRQRLYECRDGWIYVEARETQASNFAENITGNRNAGEKKLEEAFLEQNCSYWLAKLADVDIACHRVVSILDTRNKSMRSVTNEAADEIDIDECEALCWEEHPCGKPVILMNPKQVRVGEDRSYKRLAPAPRFGQHTKEILQEIGYSEKNISELIRVKAAHTCLIELGDENSYFFKAASEK